MLTRGWLALLPLAVGGHNWMHEPRSRSGGSSTRLKARPTVRDPHVQVGPNQTFVLTWTTGHGGSYIFVVVHKDDEDKLPEHKAANHGGVAVQEYLDEAPPEAFIYEDYIWQRWFVSCSYLHAYDSYAPGKNVTMPGEGGPDDYPGENPTYIGPRNCGGCSRLSSISTSLIADHCKGRMRKLGLGGCVNVNDIDLEDIGRCVSLEWLSLCACPKVSDAGIKQIGLLAGKQAKAYASWQEQGATQQAPPPPTLTHLELGGLSRLLFQHSWCYRPQEMTAEWSRVERGPKPRRGDEPWCSWGFVNPTMPGVCAEEK